MSKELFQILVYFQSDIDLQSSEILPELREFERFATTAMNAYLAPMMNRYVRRLTDDLSGSRYHGDLYTMASNGGLMSSATTVSNERSSSTPTKTSGPTPAACR